MSEHRAVPRHRQAQDLGRARDPAPRRRHDVDQRPHARGVLPARDAPRRTALAPLQGRRASRARSTSASACTAAGRAARPAPSATASPGRSSRPIRSCASPLKREGFLDARRAHRRAQEGRPAQGAQGAAVLQALTSLPWRRYFGTDGVRGVVGEDLTPELVERLGRAATLWSGGGRVFIGRDTRGSGRGARGGVRPRRRRRPAGNAVLAGVLPTPAVALLALDLGVVISASHNPPEYNGVKFFDGDGRKLTDAAEEEIEALLDAPPRRVGRRDRPRRRRDRQLPRARRRALRQRPLRPADRGRLRERRVLRDRAAAFEQLGAEVTRDRRRARTARTSTSAAAPPTSRAAAAPSRATGLDLGVAFDGDGDRMLAVDARGRGGRRRPDPRVLALAPRRRPRRGDGDDEPRLPPADGGARDPRRHDRRRRPLRARGAAARGRRPRRRAVGPHHLPRRPRHRRRPRRGAAALRRARGPDARRGGRRDAALPAGEGERPRRAARSSRRRCSHEVERAERASSAARAACSCARPGTEPVVRVLAEAETEEEAAEALW